METDPSLRPPFRPGLDVPSRLEVKRPDFWVMLMLAGGLAGGWASGTGAGVGTGVGTGAVVAGSDAISTASASSAAPVAASVSALPDAFFVGLSAAALLADFAEDLEVLLAKGLLNPPGPPVSGAASGTSTGFASAFSDSDGVGSCDGCCVGTCVAACTTGFVGRVVDICCCTACCAAASGCFFGVYSGNASFAGAVDPNPSAAALALACSSIFLTRSAIDGRKGDLELDEFAC